MQHGFIKVAAATPRVQVADPVHNAAEIAQLARRAAQEGVRLLVSSELSLTGYTCGDLFLQRTLLQGALDALLRLAADTRDLDLMLIVGLPYAHRGTLYNCAAALYGGEILGLVPKTWLPNYAEFYERRYFTSGRRLEGCTVEIGAQTVPFGCDLLFCHRFMPELKVGVELCEDLWAPDPPSTALALAGATVICNPSASDELVTKDEYRRQLVSSHAARLVCGYVYCNAGDGESTQDVVYTGQNLICENGVLLAESEAASGLTISELDVQRLDHERRKMGYFHRAGRAGVVRWRRPG